MDIIKLYEFAEKEQYRTIDWIDVEKAATTEMAGNYFIFINTSNISTRKEEKTILAHEIGHCATGATHRLSSPYDIIEKHEYKANKYAIMKLIPKVELKNAIKKGHTEVWDLAEYFGVTEDFVKNAVYIYKGQEKL